MLLSVAPPLSLPAPGVKSRLLRPSGGLGLEGIAGICECEGGVPGRPPQQLLLPPAPPPVLWECVPWPPGLRGGGRPHELPVVGPAARCRLPFARPSSARLHLPRGLRQSCLAARNLQQHQGHHTRTKAFSTAAKESGVGLSWRRFKLRIAVYSRSTCDQPLKLGFQTQC